MHKTILVSLLCWSVSAQAGFWGGDFKSSDVDTFQPPIVSSQAPERPLNAYSLYNNTTLVGLGDVLPIVPAFNHKGLLMASWTPNKSGIKGRPTVVILHGGHGIVTTDWAEAVWVRDNLNANVLVLDSYWSRGRSENWQTYNTLGANARALDAIAAGQWVKSQGVDPDKIFLMGDSQGGWSVLRTMTDEPFYQTEAKPLFRAGISLYPVCQSSGGDYKPRLGAYHSPVIVFTGGRDDASPVSQCKSSTFESATVWKHYPEATHGWDISNRGARTPSVDGECTTATNVLNHFTICRNNAVTDDMHTRIKEFVNGVLN